MQVITIHQRLEQLERLYASNNKRRITYKIPMRRGNLNHVDVLLRSIWRNVYVATNLLGDYI